MDGEGRGPRRGRVLMPYLSKRVWGPLFSGYDQIFYLRETSLEVPRRKRNPAHPRREAGIEIPLRDLSGGCTPMSVQKGCALRHSPLPRVELWVCTVSAEVEDFRFVCAYQTSVRLARLG